MDSLKSLIELEFPKIKLVDVGAMLTTDQTRYKKLLEKDLVNVIGFEADEDQYLKLQLQNKKNPEYLNYCLGDGSKKNFYITRYPGCSSLYEPNESVINLFTGISASEKGNFNVLNKKLVQTKRLDDIIEVKSTDLLKIDTQGSELDILKSFSNNIKNTLVIESEVEFVEMYKNQPLFSDVSNFLKEKNFILHKLIDIGGRPFKPFSMKDNPAYPMSQLLWADAIFIRDFTKLENFSDQDLLKTSLILHDMYDSYDLCHLLLSEYDKRNKKDLHQKYSKMLGKFKLELKFMNLKTDIDSTTSNS
jgi:FkbM family methyltransferase|tara:strand:+ start:266 stop:1177 length:912 start_codon:yes stop_codon:yes gene_type:complete